MALGTTTWSRVLGHRMISKLDEDNGTEGSLGWDNEGSQAVLTTNADESKLELAWADPSAGEMSGEVFVTGD